MAPMEVHMSDNKTLEARIGALEMKIKFMEARMTSDMSSMMELFSSPVISAEVVAENNKEAAGIELAEFRIQLSKMTPKQHVALQMVIGLCENAEIARVVGVRENSAKMYVKNVSAKLGLRFRGDVREKARRLLESVSDVEYIKMSGGIPKDWWDKRDDKKVDKYAAIYQKARSIS
jgi:DNA-binding CsgD family transcriptional regulator|tara:strand:- start:40 stop:567 length:528 start_codon:yes stop_codon:yes gene_type:complete